MITLAKTEQPKFDNFIINILPHLRPGTYYFRDFFPGDSQRIARRLYEEVAAGMHTRLTLTGAIKPVEYLVS